MNRTSTQAAIRLLVLSLCCAPYSVWAQTQTTKVKVFVTSVGAANGFTDPSKDNRDTVKDLQNSLRRHKALAMAEDRDGADIVLVVIGRETAQVTAGLFGDPARDRMIRVKFFVGELETDLTASAQGGTLGSGGAWGRAAGKIADQVNDWVSANRTRLPTGRSSPQDRPTGP